MTKTTDASPCLNYKKPEQIVAAIEAENKKSGWTRYTPACDEKRCDECIVHQNLMRFKVCFKSSVPEPEPKVVELKGHVVVCKECGRVYDAGICPACGNPNTNATKREYVR